MGDVEEGVGEGAEAVCCCGIEYGVDLADCKNK